MNFSSPVMQPPEVSSAVAALQRGDLSGARQICQSAIDAGRGHADIWHILGILEAQANRGDAAIQAFSASIKAEPRHVGSLTNLALLYRRSGRSDLAVSLYRQALESDSENASIHRGLASSFLALGETQDALAAVDRAIRISPNDHEAVRLRLNILIQDEGRPVPIDDVERLVAANPEVAANQFLAGLAYSRSDREQDARAALEKCLELQPSHHQAMNNLARQYFEAGEYDPARRLYEQAIEVRPDYAEARFQLGQLQLVHGEYEQGWSNYAWRYRSNNYRRFGNRAQTTLPFWDGSPLAGRRLVIYAEQGLGDTVQFLRYLPNIDPDGGQVICIVQRALLGLVQGFDRARAEIRSFEDVSGEELAAEVQSPLLSLPGLLWSNVGSAAASVPYMQLDQAAVSKWRQRLGEGAGRPRIGLVWSGNPHHSSDANRSIPTSVLASLVNQLDADWISLHVGEAAGQSDHPALAGRVQNVSADLTDFSSTAALMSVLDLTITVDTAPAHVAGAIGAPVWTLLPYVPDWRWGLSGDHTIWYPTMQLFRQGSPGDWGETLVAVGAAVRARF